jgi:hypothetical protein
MSFRRRGSIFSLASQQSASSWAGIDDPDRTTRNPLLETEVGQIEIGQSETSEEQQNRSEEEYDPFRRKAVVWSGEHQFPVVAVFDTGTRINIIDKKVVAQLDAPINRLTTPAIDLRSADLSGTEGTVMLVLKFEDSPEYTEARFHVLSGWDSELPFNVVLGSDWLRTTETFLYARHLGEMTSTIF